MFVDPPAGLAAKGKKLWVGVTGEYELRVDELRLLEDAAHLADTIALLEKGMRGQDLTVRGSQGQPVLNPLLGEQKAHRTALAGLLKQLRLPDASGEVPNQQREAAQARWAARGA